MHPQADSSTNHNDASCRCSPAQNRPSQPRSGGGRGSNHFAANLWQRQPNNVTAFGAAGEVIQNVAPLNLKKSAVSKGSQQISIRMRAGLCCPEPLPNDLGKLSH
jgi:hypothetical protein